MASADRAEFLAFLGVIFWPALDEPLRSTLPPILNGVEIVRSACFRHNARLSTRGPPDEHPNGSPVQAVFRF